MFQEGLLIPPIRIWQAGRPLPDIERLILGNSRQPELVRGDMQAQIAVTRMGAARVKELCERFGAETAVRRLRRDPRRAPPTNCAPPSPSCRPATASAAGPSRQRRRRGRPPDQARGDGHDRRRHRRASISPPATPRRSGPVNLRPSMVEACVFYCLIGCLGPNLAFNDGMRDVVRLVFAPRTVTNAEPPAAGLELPDGQPQAGRCDPRGAVAIPSGRAPSPMRAHRARSALPGAKAAPANRPCSTRSSAPPMGAAPAMTALRRRRRI